MLWIYVFVWIGAKSLSVSDDYVPWAIFHKVFHRIKREDDGKQSLKDFKTEHSYQKSDV